MRVTLIACVLIALSSTHAFAALGTIRGKESKGWSTGHYNVVVGVIKDIQPIKGKEYGFHRATFVPAATLAGTFDASLYPTLPVSFHATGFTTSIREAPPEGATIMAVMQLLPPNEEEGRKQTGGFFYSDLCTFMPGNTALVVIQGLDDPQVRETLKKLQDARARPDPDPYRRPAKPQTEPDKK